MAAAPGHARRARHRDRPVQADRVGERAAAERAGAVVDTGERTTGRGRVGSYYALPATRAARWWSGIAPEGIVAEAVDVYGDVVARARHRSSRAPGAGRGRPGAARGRRRGRRPVAARRRERRRSGGPRRPAGWSSCRTRRSWSARSTRRPCSPSWSTAPSPSTTTSTGRPAPSSAARGCATSSTCTSARGSAAPWSATARCAAATPGWRARSRTWSTVGPDGAAMRLTDVFAALGLRRAGSTAIDVSALLDA